VHPGAPADTPLPRLPPSPHTSTPTSAWGRALGKDATSAASDERSLRSFLAYCHSTLGEPQLAASPVTQALVDAEKRRAIGLAPAVTSALESHRAALGSLKAFMDWCAMVATVGADVERALADVAEDALHPSVAPKI
jgi:hypothetical protein